MEGLMSEATDLILSSHRNTIIGPYKVMKLESGNLEIPEVSPNLNSFTLLRLSITNSIKHRHVGVEVSSGETTKPNKCKRCKEPRTATPKVDFRLLNSELDTSYPEGKTSKEKGSLIEQNKSDVTTKAFTELLDDTQISDPEITNNIQSQIETESYKKEETLDNEEQKNRKKIVQNGMKLASRKFSDSIYENCSTYSLSYPGVLQEREDFTPGTQNLPFNDQSLATGVPAVNDHICAESVKSSTSDNGSCADDPVSLSDSFFGKITNEENASQSSLFLSEGDNTSVRTENGLSVPEYYSSGTEAQKRERKHSKKLRKRNKKSKSKNVPMYECPKCGVSYILSTKTSESTARCLHCDFWTSVEPEFLKKEKQVWNTCRIC